MAVIFFLPLFSPLFFTAVRWGYSLHPFLTPSHQSTPHLQHVGLSLVFSEVEGVLLSFRSECAAGICGHSRSVLVFDVLCQLSQPLCLKCLDNYSVWCVSVCAVLPSAHTNKEKAGGGFV